MNIPIINGVEYSWSSIKATIMGVPIVGITEIMYKDKQKIDGIKGAGAFDVAVGYGDVDFEASITLLKSEYDAIKKVAPNKRLQEIPPFSIQINYQQGVKIDTVILQSCIFKETGAKSATGDTSIKIELPLYVANIQQ